MTKFISRSLVRGYFWQAIVDRALYTILLAYIESARSAIGERWGRAGFAEV
ncbi:MAG: hypothetical protein KME17_24315 [Cyanosarcina radialis HA8281-LM2]|nr:hypothetical protein [Cyanosarcina radialis HA8281-LM2]